MSHEKQSYTTFLQTKCVIELGRMANNFRKDRHGTVENGLIRGCCSGQPPAQKAHENLKHRLIHHGRMSAPHRHNGEQQNFITGMSFGQSKEFELNFPTEIASISSI